MLSAIRLPPAPLVKAASRGAAACITTPVPRAAAAALSTAAAGFVACKAPKRAQACLLGFASLLGIKTPYLALRPVSTMPTPSPLTVAPPTLPEPALDAFLSPSGAVPVPSFGALLFPAFGGVRSRIERNYERSSLLIWPRRSHSTSASGPPSEIDAKAPAATVNPSAEDDRALIDRLPELLRKPFEAKWEAPALRKHLLEKLSTAQLFLSQKNAISVVQTELSAFASVVPEAISDVVATRKKDVEKIHSAGDPRTFAQTFYGWVEQWSKNHGTN
ncbi:hypothetical protein CAOG_009584 [Capsaspora owczarzaki ATCC 30864]|uniref:Uncharacterized protein n=1 Tax=Capsaspora owczarzaki (strain ATCC 30864) TaxID=595528 RepID=A0A0D2WLY2_CAPO3|nr:hypothetical protein CAOG_009584 [Capsaspora owczarzaki ATCC 30864]